MTKCFTVYKQWGKMDAWLQSLTFLIKYTFVLKPTLALTFSSQGF